MGQEVNRFTILAITNSSSCSVTISGEHGLSTGDFVRITDLNSSIPVKRGVDQINNGKFRVYVTAVDSFVIQDPITSKPVDSTTYPPYVTGGSCNKVESDFQYTAE